MTTFETFKEVFTGMKATTTIKLENVIQVQLYNTVVFKYDTLLKQITLNTGDYATMTTLRRMNSALNIVNSNFKVVKKNNELLLLGVNDKFLTQLSEVDIYATI